MSAVSVTVGVLALQGGFLEHLNLARAAGRQLSNSTTSSDSTGPSFDFIEVRNEEELSRCDALIIPGGESTTISLAAARSGLLQPLRKFVKYE
jgi:5'-phosphate synthase pdxT subunit